MHDLLAPSIRRPANASGNVNLARFDLVSMRLAVLCAETGSLSAAARRAHCSLSTGSHRLSALEDSFGAQLFTRDHRGLQPTEAGELFLAHARSILERIELMSRQVRSAALAIG
ncbi:MAG TPA: LysR family transcriptional regulator [Ramlibacter sp.]|nr:LysR family transcriptional regulator [Ramlibacter sp.]